MQTPGTIEYNGIYFLPDYVVCYEGKMLFDAIQREHIRAVSVRYTWLDRNPLVILIYVVWTMRILIYFFDWIPGSRALDSTIAWTLFLAVTVILSITLVKKRGPVLIVQLERKQRKLPFSGPLETDRVRELLAGASAMGYPVDLSSADTLPQPPLTVR